MKPDFGRTAADYARFRAGFPPELFERLREKGVGLPGQRVLDLGAGTGTVGRELPRGGCIVTDLDPSLEPWLDSLAKSDWIENDSGVSVATIEHLMAALAGCGIHNVLIEIDGPEAPIMDGSAISFVKILEKAGI